MKCDTRLSNDGNRLICLICKTEQPITYPVSVDEFINVILSFDNQHRDCALVNSCAVSAARRPEVEP